MTPWLDRQGRTVVSRKSFTPFTPLKREEGSIDIHDPKTWPRRTQGGER